MLANLWMLNAPNGMFWYAVDYLRGLQMPMKVIVRPPLLEVARRELNGPGVEIHAVSAGGFLLSIILAAAGRKFVYAPTPHPVPLLPRQLVTFHDAFPFEGPKGRVKLALFRLGVYTARSTVAYINRSTALPFLEAIGVPATKLLFAPNIPPQGTERGPPRDGSRAALPMRLGAFGTDSPKKRYPHLLSLLAQDRFRDALRLCIYGGENQYTAGLRSRFPEGLFEIIDPRSTSLPEFIATLDACISIAPGEGFGRPLATAIASGVPCYLVNSPTFCEFFTGFAVMDDSVEALLEAALTPVVERRPSEQCGFLSLDYAHAIESALTTLSAMAGVDSGPTA